MTIRARPAKSGKVTRTVGFCFSDCYNEMRNVPISLKPEAQLVQRVVAQLDGELAATRPARAGLPVVGESAGCRVEAQARWTLSVVIEGATGALPQLSEPTVAEVNDAGFVTYPPRPSGSFQRMGTNAPRDTRFSVGGALIGPIKPSKLNSDSTVNACVTAVVKFTRSLPVTLKVRAPAVRGVDEPAVRRWRRAAQQRDVGAA